MIFNRWRRYPSHSPKENGWYQCVCQHGAGYNNPRVMDMYYFVNLNKWVDGRRQSVFDGYKVYKPDRAPIEDNRVWSDGDCERIDILAWRKLPEIRKVGNLK